MTDHVLAPDFKFGAMENWGKYVVYGCLNMTILL